MAWHLAVMAWHLAVMAWHLAFMAWHLAVMAVRISVLPVLCPMIVFFQETELGIEMPLMALSLIWTHITYKMVIGPAGSIPHTGLGLG